MWGVFFVVLLAVLILLLRQEEYLELITSTVQQFTKKMDTAMHNHGTTAIKKASAYPHRFIYGGRR